MVTVQRILCPTDFSKPSNEAVRVASDLASQFSAELVLLHVLTPFPTLPVDAVMSVDPSFILEKVRENAEQTLELLVQKKVPNGVHPRTKIVQGGAADEIVKTANDEHADMIVIATHGNTGLQHLLLGSVAEKVVRHASCPVLTVRVPHSSN